MIGPRSLATLALALGLSVASVRGDEPTVPPDALIIADFEGDDYAGWIATGDAFGPRPARGTLAGQMHVDGFLGLGLVNSFLGGDAAAGTLTSPPFEIRRKTINLLVGGGKFSGETCVDLLVDGRVVRSATGPNGRPGGSERLGWASWDVAEFAGKSATIRVVDARGGSWGHINVDHIVQSDRRLQPEPARRDLVVSSRYLHLPVKNGAAKRRLKLLVDGRTIREFEIELADGPPDFLAFADLAEFRGRPLVIEADPVPPGSTDLSMIAQAETPPDPEGLYRERLRPRFHFTSRRGWLNDPNGLVYHEGEYHLFYQHNPYGWDWGNMHWGHAVSPDLVRWTELPIAIYPRRFGDWAFSGSAVVDKGGLIAAFTSTGRGECIATSADRGRTWAEVPGNPILAHEGRDPKIIWHEPTKRWVMVVYDEAPGRKSIALHASPDLKSWTYLSRVDDFFECPDLFELPVDGDPARTRWVLHAADGLYVIGTFDGEEFRKESGKHRLWSGNFYAAQSFSDMPDGRRVQVGWARGVTFPGMPFNQQMTVPVELTLRTTPEGVRMFAEPVREVASLVRKTHRVPARGIVGTEPPMPGISVDAVAIRLEIEPGSATMSGLLVRGTRVAYDAKSREVRCGDVVAHLDPIDGRIALQILVDRGSIEVFGNGGRVALSVGVIPPDGERSLRLFAEGGTSRLRSLQVDELGAIWGR